MVTDLFEPCTAQQWEEITTKLQCLEDQFIERKVDERNTFSSLERCTKFYGFLPLNYVAGLLPKINARYIGMVDFKIFYVGTDGKLYVRIWGPNGACLRQVQFGRYTLPRSFVEPLMEMISL